MPLSFANAAALIFIVSACAPCQDPKSTFALFTMTIQPPAIWSYPETPDKIRPPQVAASKAAVQAKFHKDILQELNLILVENNFPVNSVNLTVYPVNVVGNIVTLRNGTCPGTQKGIVLSGGRTVVQRCTGENNGAPVGYDAKEVTGSFDARGAGLGLSEEVWKDITVKLEQALTELGAVFSKDLVITPDSVKD